MLTREGYEIFVRKLDQIEEGKEIEIEVRHCQTCQVKAVRAILSSSSKQAPDGELLWVRALVGHLLDEKPWRIRITKVLEER